jgi:hypothetical protein
MRGVSRNVFVRTALIAVGAVSIAAAVLIVLGNRGSGSEESFADNWYLHTDAIPTPKPCFSAPREYTTTAGGGGGDALVVDDLNGDGRPDLAAADLEHGAVAVRMNSGRGGFEPARTFRTGRKPDWVAAGDLDGNLSPDLVTTNADDGTVSVLLKGGSDSFRRRTDYRVGEVPDSVVIGDVDGDGSGDLVTTNELPAGTSSILLNNGDGTFRAGRTISTGRDVALGDLNGDGSQDLVALGSKRKLSVFLNDGRGGFDSKADYRTGDGPTALAIGDLNADGRPDLVTANYGIEPMGVGDTLSVLLNKGAGSFGRKHDFTTREYPTSVVIGDATGDGKPDLVSADAETQNIAVFANNGAGGFGEPLEYPSDELPGGIASVALADINGDGRPDLLANIWHAASVLLRNPGSCDDRAFVD